MPLPWHRIYLVDFFRVGNLEGDCSSLLFLGFHYANWLKKKAMKPRSGRIPGLLAHGQSALLLMPKFIWPKSLSSYQLAPGFQMYLINEEH